MATATAFGQTNGQYHASVTATPTATPFQLVGNAQSVRQQIRIVVANTTSGLVHIAWGQTAQIATNIAGAGGTPTAGQQTPLASSGGGMLTFLGSEVEVLDFPVNSFFALWCGTAAATADVYMSPGEGV
jgi:hypothetical protein